MSEWTIENGIKKQVRTAEDIQADRDYFNRRAWTKRDLKLFSSMKVLILSPIFSPEIKWIRCLANMIAYSWHFGLRVEKMGITEKMVVDWARNTLVDEALKDRSYFDGKPFTHLLWLDCDHVFDPDMACHLARHGLDAVSALYYARTGEILPVAYMENWNDANGYSGYPLLEIPNTLWEVSAFGFGACLIKREVFEKVGGPFWFTLDYKCGEDFAFCRQARQKGVRFFVDGTYRIGHIGPGPVIDHKEAVRYREEHPELDKNRVMVDDRGCRIDERPGEEARKWNTTSG